MTRPKLAVICKLFYQVFMLNHSGFRAELRLGLRLQTWDQWVAARYRRSLLARAEARCIAANIAHAAGDAAEGLTAKAHLTGDTGFLSYSE